ncbi:MAG: type II secretion system F family protein [Ardenticatenaceae bacterium]|nr:type II secretion system F family protein [Ardenticatenaceae bacterium]
MFGLLIIAAAVIIIYSLILLRRAEEDPLAARIDEFASREEVVSIEEIELSMPLSDRVLVPIARRISDFVVKLTPQSTLERTTHQLELAGNPRNMTAAGFWILRLLVMVLFGALGFLVASNNQAGVSRTLAYIFGALVIGFFIPGMVLRSRIDRRKQAIIKKLPDALDLMTICVEAGLAFNGAMQRVAEKWDDPLANEFGRVLQEMQLGKSRRQALRDMVDRMEVPDVTSFIAAILQADQLGGGVSKILRIQSEQMRIRRRQRAEEKAQQAPVKMLFPLVFLIFPSVLMVLLGPAALQVLRSGPLRGVLN